MVPPPCCDSSFSFISINIDCNQSIWSNYPNISKSVWNVRMFLNINVFKKLKFFFVHVLPFLEHITKYQKKKKTRGSQRLRTGAIRWISCDGLECDGKANRASFIFHLGITASLPCHSFPLHADLLEISRSVAPICTTLHQSVSLSSTQYFCTTLYHAVPRSITLYCSVPLCIKKKCMAAPKMNSTGHK